MESVELLCDQVANDQPIQEKNLDGTIKTGQIKLSAEVLFHYD